MQAVENERAAQLRELAEYIRNNLFHAAAIAQGFILIADCMEPCYDCGHPEDDPAPGAHLVQIEADKAVTEIPFTAAGEILAVASY